MCYLLATTHALKRDIVVNMMHPHHSNIPCFMGNRIGLRGNCTPDQKMSIFCAVSQNYQYFFWKMICVSYSKLSKELKNSIDI